ncbi:MAG: hypothetical protein SFY92_10985 [Verrucomicrobiae bacterium]|nr:hypothetical protein [Verrucomicrobiae bacterium]
MHPGPLNILLVALLPLSGLTAFAQKTSHPKGDFVEPATGVRFPEKLAGLDRTMVVDYESEKPGLGMGIKYEGPVKGWVADLYLYSSGLPPGIPSLNDPGILAHFEQVQADLKTMEASGYYQNVKKLDSGVRTIGSGPHGLPALWAEYSYSARDGISRRSHVILGICRGHYFKIRYTYPASEKKAETSLPLLLRALSDSLKKPAPPAAI